MFITLACSINATLCRRLPEESDIVQEQEGLSAAGAVGLPILDEASRAARRRTASAPPEPAPAPTPSRPGRTRGVTISTNPPRPPPRPQLPPPPPPSAPGPKRPPSPPRPRRPPRPPRPPPSPPRLRSSPSPRRSPQPLSPRPPSRPPSPPPPSPEPPQRPAGDKPLPNVLLVLSDDQDQMYGSAAPRFMPAVNKWLGGGDGGGGTQLSNFLITTAVCCPARTSILTGKHAHCHNVTTNYYPSGGFVKFLELDVEKTWLPTRLQEAGYQTILVGKFLNGYYTSEAPAGYVPKGFTVFDALTTNAYNMTNSCFSRNGGRSTCYPSDYQTDLIGVKAKNYISAAVRAKKPFFAYVTPTAPHRSSTNLVTWHPPTPASRHKDLYADENVTLPLGPNWDVRNPDLPRKGNANNSPTFLANINALHLARLGSLRAVDEMVDSLVGHLQDLEVLDNTIVIYMSDNGYHMGAFSLLDGKNLPIEEDVRVPFFIRGPGIPAGQVLPHQSTNVDLAPTLLALAGLPIPPDMDGLPLPLSEPLMRPVYEALLQPPQQQQQQQQEPPQPPPAVTVAAVATGPWQLREASIMEGWNGDGSDENARYAAHFKTLRLCTDTLLLSDSAFGPAAARQVPVRAGGPPLVCYKYTVWCQGNRELYDLAADPYELINRINDAAARVVDRLDAVLSALVHCSGVACRNPYSLLHPGGGVRKFSMLLAPEYDAFYSGLTKLRIKTCSKFYIPDNEVTWTQQGVGSRTRGRG
ncbi:hypothetical protein CHLRE_01g012100v5 [Chlamydomonas reinhardtii]|uniref:Sulfatase N-terminal domain-containing protein n=1 Tax=Chlamydomonas reinhardtii TaxID=3055 RepID=A0A2K3E5H9_CHLRE|nr:uncharacterized protein CHLRE_01g012100v5 [Chlamydomonas reinhardtii]PNW88048.1 hypothetical protein CHLRE_01g012100v5 [Chlamydomonas reinhardtii]